ncbi:hypothetical protein [Leisingera sp. ANG-Vp]|uniref:hypothetical protein n=1 Tax=Leisingera sp. ANG-Vp TaxID=1577896 RepID=UPI001269F6B7|nr:hypothetical protein [Leisingera sp. ANG-Vp]
MSDYEKTSFEDRLKLAEFRCRLTTQVISVALLINAIPATLKIMFQLPSYAANSLFWNLLFIAWFFACAAIASALLFESLAPRWARDGPIENLRSRTMNFSYLSALVCLGAATVLFTSSIAFAVLEFDLSSKPGVDH